MSDQLEPGTRVYFLNHTLHTSKLVEATVVNLVEWRGQQYAVIRLNGGKLLKKPVAKLRRVGT